MRYRDVYAFVLLLGVMAVGFPSHAFADLISVTTIPGGGSNLVPGSTLVTIHHGGNGSESGCITPNGAYASCLNTATTQVAGGDNVGLNQVLSLSTDSNFGVVVAPKEPGDNFNGSLTDLYITFSSSNGSYTAEYTGPDVLLSSGLALFTLEDSDFAAVQSLGNLVTVSGGFAVAGQSRGPESLHVVQLGTQGPDSVNAAATVPEPSTLLLLGGGLLVLGLSRISRLQPRSGDRI